MNILKFIRLQHGLNGSQMARRLGISKSYYSMLERGIREPSKNVAVRIHREFHVPLEVILIHHREVSAND